MSSWRHKYGDLSKPLLDITAADPPLSKEKYQNTNAHSKVQSITFLLYVERVRFFIKMRLKADVDAFVAGFPAVPPSLTYERRGGSRNLVVIDILPEVLQKFFLSRALEAIHEFEPIEPSAIFAQIKKTLKVDLSIPKAVSAKRCGAGAGVESVMRNSLLPTDTLRSSAFKPPVPRRRTEYATAILSPKLKETSETLTFAQKHLRDFPVD